MKKQYYVIDKKSISMLRRKLKRLKYNILHAGKFPYVLHLNYRPGRQLPWQPVLTIIITESRTDLKKITLAICHQNCKELKP